MDASDYLSQMLQLLPRGKAWKATPDSLLGKLLMAFPDGSARVDARMLDLLAEADPRTATELIGAWEETVGLPDGCTGALTDLDDRRAAVWQKYTAQGGQSAEHFKAVAASLGYDVRIDEYDVFTCVGRCDDFVRDTAWAFAWTVVVKPVDEDSPDLGPFQSPGLECIISGAAPSHTRALFDYPTMPAPTFHFNFIEGL